MKKLIVFCMGVLLIFSLAACSNQTVPKQSPEVTNNLPTVITQASMPTETPIPTPAETPIPTPAETPIPTPTELPKHVEGKTLVVYFSWSSNTERMANTIQAQTGGDVFEIVPLNAYPDDYTECTEVALEERDNDARPAIQNMLSSIEEYDKILIGYPIWWHTAPMIGTFVESYDLTGVDIYPFTQSASMNREQFNNSMDFIRGCAEGATVYDGLFARYSDNDAIISYLSEYGLIKED